MAIIYNFEKEKIKRAAPTYEDALNRDRYLDAVQDLQKVLGHKEGDGQSPPEGTNPFVYNPDEDPFFNPDINFVVQNSINTECKQRKWSASFHQNCGHPVFDPESQIPCKKYNCPLIEKIPDLE